MHNVPMSTSLAPQLQELLGRFLNSPPSRPASASNLPFKPRCFRSRIWIRIKGSLPRSKNIAAAVIALPRRLASEETSGSTAAEYGAAGQRAQAASFRLWTVATEELDALLQKRIDVFQTRRAKSLVVACLALLAAVVFVSFITRSISIPLRKQTELLQVAHARFQDEIADRRATEAAIRLCEAHPGPIHVLITDQAFIQKPFTSATMAHNLHTGLGFHSARPPAECGSLS